VKERLVGALGDAARRRACAILSRAPLLHGAQRPPVRLAVLGMIITPQARQGTLGVTSATADCHPLP